ncbi:GNAT family N-acetyltransferase [Streptomyces specialis]|uniref:GNAT family N-acetyltransferase n=1 Tax=Streptomyces specialis TaxID=498367 RepID=UPI00073EB701|nr:GNAT family N-acetyltransferase [Streptomyces specialis]
MRIEYRRAEPSEVPALAALDDSFTTDTVHEITVTPESFALRPVRVDPPLTKTFPPDPADLAGGDEAPEYIDAAWHDGTPCGVLMASVEEWNSRLVIQRITVAPAFRGRGVGTALMSRACAHGRAAGARTAWLETSNVNAPAVRAYRRMGFALCGLDTTLYRGTPSEGETALFLSRPLDIP